MGSRVIKHLGSERLCFDEIREFSFNRDQYSHVEISEKSLDKVKKARSFLEEKLQKNDPIYGVTTGYGAQCRNSVNKEQSIQLQENLISYLHCGVGPLLPWEAVRACQLIHLHILALGFSAVRPELLKRLKLFVDEDYIAEVPAEGSLGASGDLVPMSYVANVLIGRGRILHNAKLLETASLDLPEFKLAEKEGLSLVNGVSMMLGMSVYNIQQMEFLLDLSFLESAWLLECVEAKLEAFSPLINEHAKTQKGQTEVAQRIRCHLEENGYLQRSTKKNVDCENPIQDKYSIRCVPQILGPVYETIELSKNWIENEANSCSDNPIFNEKGDLAHGGNFYGSYIAHSMDYLKISLAHMCDLIDRQLTTLVDKRHSRGLSNNLVDIDGLGPQKQNIHHGLKGLHQAVNALASEVNALAIPNSIFSRSSENHNQDKVSLGMSAANQLQSMIDKSIRMHALYLICLCQALDMRGLKEGQSETSKRWYTFVRERVPFVTEDRSLNEAILKLIRDLKEMSFQKKLFAK